MRKPPRVKVGDIVELAWVDIMSLGRISDEGDDSEIKLPVFVSWGRVSYSDNERIVLLHECEQTQDPHPTREPTIYPWGCVQKVTRLRP